MQALSCDASQQNTQFHSDLKNFGAALKTKAPGHEAGRMREMVLCEAGQTVDCATTDLRQGFNTNTASSEARMLAPAAMMNTLSQWPEVCCT